MDINYQISKLIRRYEHTLFVEYFENMQDQVLLNFPGLVLSMSEFNHRQIILEFYKSKQTVTF